MGGVCRTGKVLLACFAKTLWNHESNLPCSQALYTFFFFFFFISTIDVEGILYSDALKAGWYPLPK